MRPTQENETTLLTIIVHGKRGWSTGDPNSIFRWEDDGGRMPITPRDQEWSTGEPLPIFRWEDDGGRHIEKIHQ